MRKVEGMASRLFLQLISLISLPRKQGVCFTDDDEALTVEPGISHIAIPSSIVKVVIVVAVSHRLLPRHRHTLLPVVHGHVIERVGQIVIDKGSSSNGECALVQPLLNR